MGIRKLCEINYKYVFMRDFLLRNETTDTRPVEHEERKDENKPISDLFVNTEDNTKEALKTSDAPLQTNPEKTTD